jgi:hypothetical protein
MVRKHRRKFSSLLNFSVSSESFGSQVLLRDLKLLESTGPHTAEWTYGWLRRYGSKAMVHPHYSPELMPSDFHLFGSYKYTLTTSEADLKLGFVLRWDARFGAAVGQMLNFKADYMEV